MVDQAIGLLFILLSISVFYFIFYRKRHRYNKLKKHGLKIRAKVISITETNSFEGDDSFALPVSEILVELEYPKSTTRKETIRHTFSKWESVPKAGDSIVVLIDKTKPGRIYMYD